MFLEQKIQYSKDVNYPQIEEGEVIEQLKN